MRGGGAPAADPGRREATLDEGGRDAPGRERSRCGVHGDRGASPGRRPRPDYRRRPAGSVEPRVGRMRRARTRPEHYKQPPQILVVGRQRWTKAVETPQVVNDLGAE